MYTLKTKDNTETTTALPINENQIVFREMTPEKKQILDKASFLAFQDSGLQPRSWRQAYYHSRFIDICQWEVDGWNPAKAPRWLPGYLRDFLATVELDNS